MAKVNNRIASFFVFLFLFFFVVVSKNAHATELKFGVKQTQTGGIVGLLNTVGDDYCPTATTPGCDFSNSDGIVRTNDDIEFEFSVSVGPEGDGPIIIKTELDPGLLWVILPSSCNQFTSTITGDGTLASPSVLTCDLGTQQSFSSTFNVTVRAMGNNPNGTTAGIASGSIDGPTSPKVDLADIPADVTITASPRMNLRKQYQTEGPVTVNGEVFLRVAYSWWIETWKHDINNNGTDDPDPKLGNEMIVGPVTFIEDPSTVSPNAYLHSCPRLNVGAYPYETYNATFPERSVLDAGTVSCSNTGPTATGPVTVTVTGADYSLTHVPTQGRTGTAISSDRSIATFGVFYVYVPVSDIIAADGSLSSVNTVSSFDPDSISGISNLDEDLSDNTVARTLIARSGRWSKLFRHSVPGEQDADRRWFDPPTTATGNWAGDGVIQRGQTFATSSSFNNNSFGEVSEVEICDVIDSSLYEFADLNSTPGKAHVVTGEGMASGGDGTGYVVEYAVGYVGTWPPASYPNPAALTLECSHPSVQWFSTLTAARAAGTPTKFRYRRLTPQPIGSGNVIVKHRVRSDITDPNRTLLTNMATFRTSLTNMEWRDCEFEPGAFPTPTQIVDGGCGDRIALTQSLARITKITLPGDFVDVVQAGGSVRYQLAPNFTSENAISDNITVVDNLPVGVAYATNSAVWGGIPTEPVVTGTPATGQTLTWDLGIWNANDAIPTIEFDINVPITASNGDILDNTATILAVTDGSTVEQRSDTRRVTVSSPSSLLIAKRTDTPLKNEDELFRFEVEYFNGTPDNIPQIDMIDILPYNGDNRTPNSSFSGTYTVNPVTDFDSSNAVVYYSSLAPELIVNDPQDASNNLSGGSTPWCTAAQFGSGNCPTSFADVKAFRLIDSQVLPSRASRAVRVEFIPSGNFGGEVYTNRAVASGQGITLSASSPFAVTRVIEAPKLGLAKSLSAQSGVDLTFSFVVENLGNTNLTSLNLIDDLDTAFGAGNYTITSMPAVTVQPATGQLTASTSYTGSAGETNLLDPTATNSLPVGTSATVTLSVQLKTQIDMGNGLGVYENSASSEGTTPSGNKSSDISDDGTATNTNEDDPTPIVILPYDRSDLPTDGSDSPDGVGTANYGSPIHSVIAGIQLGSNVDVDLGDIGNPTATGDGTDDDSVNLPELIPGTSVTTWVEVNQAAANDGYLQGWIDWNGDGDFADAGEQIASDLQYAAGTSGFINMPIIVPANATTINTYARFRWSTTAGLDSSEPAPDGEVEDYVVTVTEKTPDVLTRPESCEAYNEAGWLTPGGPFINTQILFGSGDPERDPLVYAGIHKDLDGRIVSFYGASDSQSTGPLTQSARFELNQDNPVVPGPYISEYHAAVYKLEGVPGDSITVKFISVGGADNIYAWIEDEAGDVLTASPDFVYGTFNEVPLTFTYPSDGVVYLYGVLFDPSGNYGAIKIDGYTCVRDYGDAPDTYGTLLASDGARHGVINDVFLGVVKPDIDEDGVPGATADGDDVSTANDDEDGIASIPTLSTLNDGYSITINATNATVYEGRLVAWIDFDGNGQFDADEAAARVIPAGTTAGNFVVAWSNIPADIQVGSTYLRVRFTTDTLTAGDAKGKKVDGEVEDYQLTIVSSGFSVSGRVYVDANSNTAEDAGESGIGGTVVVLRDTATNECRSVQTSGSGHYGFVGVANGNYEIYQAHGETTPVPQNCGVANNPTGYQSTTADLLTFTVAGTNVINQDFGETAGATSTTGVNTGTGITFEPDHQSEVLPGNVAFYAHVFTTEADGAVRFNSTATGNTALGWSHLLYRDSNCDGALNGTEGNTPIAGINFGVPAGGRLCIIDKVYAPANAPARDQYSVETVATFTHQGGGLAPVTLKVTDLTITGQGATAATPAAETSRLELKKTVENLTQVAAQGLNAGDLETSDLNQASPGDVLKYRIYYRNTGTSEITDLKVNDSVPAYTGLVSGSAVCDTTPATLACTPAVSFDELNWSFVGSLNGGASGHVSYEVVVDN